ncbi:MAG: GNAT family N-acetyltransferase [Rhodothermales bacterium]|nr:GNAT family N-acetyltransferase [Rhodothermales bacterium]
MVRLDEHGEVSRASRLSVVDGPANHRNKTGRPWQPQRAPDPATPEAAGTTGQRQRIEEPGAEGPFARASFLDPWWHHLAPRLLKRGEHPAIGRAGWHILAGWGAADYSQVKPTPDLEVMAARGLIMPRVAEGSALAEWVGRRSSVTIPYDVAPGLDLRGGWEHVQSRRSSRTWSGLRRKRKKLEAGGPLEILHVDDAAGVREWLPKALRLYVARAAVAKRRGVWQTEKGRRFLEDWMTGLAAEGALDLSFLMVDGRPEAFIFGISDPASFHLYGLAFDPGSPLSRFSPGEQLLVHALKRACETGQSFFDFGVGDEPYKRAWGDGVRAVNAHVLGPEGITRSAIARWFKGRQAIRVRAKG